MVVATDTETGRLITLEELERADRLIRVAVLIERERCAKIAEAHGDTCSLSCAGHIADEIRKGEPHAD